MMINFKKFIYVPCIRWKQGEYQAITNLRTTTKDVILPLIEIPEIGYDFEKEVEVKSLDEHIKLFTKRIINKWNQRPCFIDTKLIDPHRMMEYNIHPLKYVFEQLRQNDSSAIPITGLSRDINHQDCIKDIVKVENKGLGIRFTLEEIVNDNFNNTIQDLLNSICVEPNQCDFILDLDAPNFTPIEGFAKLISTILYNIPFLKQWRSIIIIGTSFPASMGEVNTGLSIIPRYEWALYRSLIRILNPRDFRLPFFGDYVINHPAILQMDMRIVKPSASIRYTISDKWLIVKGTNVRENGTKQYKTHCKELIKSGYFYGSDFSFGDMYISDCSKGKKGTGNLTTWRWVGTNHHIETVTRDVSNLLDSINTL